MASAGHVRPDPLSALLRSAQHPGDLLQQAPRASGSQMSWPVGGGWTAKGESRPVTPQPLPTGLSMALATLLLKALSALGWLPPSATFLLLSLTPSSLAPSDLGEKMLSLQLIAHFALPSPG